MIGKKINQLATELSPLATDLTIIGDPTTGVSKKITLEQISSLFGGSVSFYTNLASFPAVGNIDIIYCAKDTNKLYLWSGSAYTEVFPSQALLDTYQLRSEKGNANGYASLDSLGKVPISQLPSSLMEYKGTWNAATNTPTLANGTGDTGDVYICNVAGTVNFGAGPLTFAVGDYVIYSGSIWQRSSGAVGTVTSVAVSRSGDALAITGSPITTSGTINLGFAGNSTQYINGAGNLVTFPGVINEAQNLITEVYNKTGATLTKGTVVYINGGQGNLPSVTKALATGDSTSAQTYGIVRNDITNNNNGYVVVAGRISDLDTQAFTEGTQLYLSPTTAGTYTSTKPYAPNHLVYVGIVVRAHPTQGVVEVKIQNGYEMDELHNVAAQNPDNNDILQYKTATSLWTKVAGTTSNIAEGSNLYYTDARSRAALSFTAGSGAYNSTTGVITIPTNTNQLTNGANYITLASLSAGAGISYNNTTGVIASTITQYTDAMARAAISLTTTGTSGAATYNSTTGVLNVPQYAPDLSGYVPTSRTLTINGTAYDLSANRSWSVGTVTSVGLSAPTGFSVSGTPVTSSGTLALSFASGYSLPTNASQTTWDTAYNRSLTAASVIGTTTKTLTLTKQDGSTLTATWTDDNTDAVTSVFGRTGAVVATSGDYNTSQVTENTNLYFTNARAIASTLTGYTSGAGTISATDTILSAIQKLNGNIGALTTGVSSVNGLTGAVTLTTSNIAEGTNLYYTEARVNANTNVAANTAARHNAVTIGTANGLSLSTQVLSLALASGSTTGALSSTDWTTFNNKQSALTNPVTGTGTTNYLPKFTGTSTIGNSIISEVSGAINVAGLLTATGGLRTTGANGYSDTDGTSTIWVSSNWTASQPAIAVTSNSPLTFWTNSVKQMTLTASGNLGLGVTPSAWESGFNVFQIGNTGVLANNTSDLRTILNSNAFNNTSGNTTYLANGFATSYMQISGTHRWYSAPSGTAGNAISFTQAMTLDASGRLGIGTTSPVRRLSVQGNDDGTLQIRMQGSYATDSYCEIGRESLSTGDFRINVCRSGTVINALKIADTTGAATFSSSVDALNLRAYSGGSLFLRNPANTFDWALYQDSSNNLKVDFNGATRLTLNSGGAATFSSSVTAGGRYIVSASSSAGITDISYGSLSGGVFVNTPSSSIGYLAAAGTAALAWSSNNVIFYTNVGNERMRIIQNGNVGIGTTSPVSLLNLNNGDIWTNVISTLRGLQFGYAGPSHGSYRAAVMGGAENYGSSDSGMLTFHTQNGYVVSAIPPERMRITSGGNVGIGDTSPISALTVRGNNNTIYTYTTDSDGQPGLVVANNSSLGASNNIMYFKTYNNAATNLFGQSVLNWSFIGTEGAANNGILFGTANSRPVILGTANTERMRITSGGNLLVGTTTDSGSKLQVTGNVNIDGVIYTNTIQTRSGVSIDFRDQTAASIMYLDATNKRVGIGTTSPSHLLQVISSSNFGAALKVSDVSTQSTGAIALGDGSTSTLGIGMWRAAENSYTTQGNWLNIQGISGIAFMSGTGAFGSNTERMTLTSSGNFGIGVTNPTEKLEVNGSIKTSAPFLGTAKPWKLGAVYTGTCVPTSWGEFASWATGMVIEVEIDGSTYRIPIVVDNYC